jgi:hypothetical protein
VKIFRIVCCCYRWQTDIYLPPFYRPIKLYVIDDSVTFQDIITLIERTEKKSFLIIICDIFFTCFQLKRESSWALVYFKDTELLCVSYQPELLQTASSQ